MLEVLLKFASNI